MAGILKVDTIQGDESEPKDELFQFCKNCGFKKKYMQNYRSSQSNCKL